jgi:hypothetical protein
MLYGINNQITYLSKKRDFNVTVYTHLHNLYSFYQNIFCDALPVRLHYIPMFLSVAQNAVSCRIGKFADQVTSHIKMLLLPHAVRRLPAAALSGQVGPYDESNLIWHD